MKVLYNITIFFSQFGIKLFALFNKKLKLFVNGRNSVSEKLKMLNPQKKTIWIHCASLGEFEQGRPIIEAIKKNHSSHQILLTFFSPSGYEIRNNYTLADVITYLPIDTNFKAKNFIKNANPSLVIFIKYEFWPNYLSELKRQNISTILISGIFRKKQPFFKWYGKWLRKSLVAFDHFFIQDENSKNLLLEMNFENCSISGDTRFDRVSQINNQRIEIEGVKEFSRGHNILVAGSTWPIDEEYLIKYINNNAHVGKKFILVPHNIDRDHINQLKTKINLVTALYSKNKTKLADVQVLIVDTIGLLSSLFYYADLAYIGGGFGSGIHNTLEPATFGLPIVIGPKYQKFKEAVDLIELGACTSVRNDEELKIALNGLFDDEVLRESRGRLAKKYVQTNTGATVQIMDYINKVLSE